MIDEIYREMAASGDIPCAATLGRDVVCTTSTTKTYGLSGIRMGAVLSSNKDIVEGVIAYNTVAAVANSAVLENLWLQFFEHRDTVLRDIRQLREERYAIVEQILSEGGVQFFAPDGGNTLIAELPRNDKERLHGRPRHKYDLLSSDSVGELSLYEFNQMNAFFGDPALTQEVFEKACKLYDHACGEPPKLGAEAFLLVALDELLETTDKHLASFTKAGFEVSPDVAPTPQLKESIKQAALARAHQAFALPSQISRTMHEMQRNIINHFPTGEPSSGSSYCYRCHRYGCSGFC